MDALFDFLKPSVLEGTLDSDSGSIDTEKVRSIVGLGLPQYEYPERDFDDMILGGPPFVWAEVPEAEHPPHQWERDLVQQSEQALIERFRKVREKRPQEIAPVEHVNPRHLYLKAPPPPRPLPVFERCAACDPAWSMEKPLLETAIGVVEEGPGRSAGQLNPAATSTGQSTITSHHREMTKPGEPSTSKKREPSSNSSSDPKQRKRCCKRHQSRLDELFCVERPSQWGVYCPWPTADANCALDACNELVHITQYTAHLKEQHPDATVTEGGKKVTRCHLFKDGSQRCEFEYKGDAPGIVRHVFSTERVHKRGLYGARVVEGGGFGAMEGLPKLECKLCGKVLETYINGNMQRLQKHLQTEHEAEFDEARPNNKAKAGVEGTDE
ncbi:hypothetical protein DFP72DRAFT_849864 [Ephemerocybe angulata]|uniref:Uncharacterized protein n=1 Tax=Ephemerocybe angulata TaxID=980116 RepID=A0A8H6M1U5_9AGAR|nr:hypothetical protein DFP72DRAFT_849864 [Tulosesus angulatus]